MQNASNLPITGVDYNSAVKIQQSALL